MLGDYGEIVILPSLLQLIATCGSGITFDARSQNGIGVVEALSDGTLDCALTAEPLIGDGIVSSLVGDDALVTMVRSDHPQVRDQLTLEQFIALQHIVYDWRDERGFIIDQRLRAQGLTRECPVSVQSVLAMPHIVAATDLACTVPARIARHFMGNEQMKSFPTPLPDLRFQVFLNWHERFDQDPGNRWLRETIGNLS